MVVKKPFISYVFPIFFLTKLKKKERTKIVIYVVAFDPIKIFTCWALKNDRQNLSFVKATNVVAKKKWSEILVKWPFHIFVIFVSKQSLSTSYTYQFAE